MQDFDWNDFKLILALSRGGSLAAAGRRLGVDETTVARRLRALERHGTALFRRRSGRLVPTPEGERVLVHALRIEPEVEAAAEALTAAPGLSGHVRITAVPLLADRMIAPALPGFLAAHSGVTVELVPSPANLSLTRREADLALRFGRPETGGMKLRMQCLARLAYAPYVAAGRPAPEGWIGHDETTAHLPQARWLDRLGGPPAGLRVADGQTALEAAAAGVGRALLPCRIADRDPRLARLPVEGLPPIPDRELWLLSLADPPRAAHRRAADWLRGLLRATQG